MDWDWALSHWDEGRLDESWRQTFRIPRLRVQWLPLPQCSWRAERRTILLDLIAMAKPVKVEGEVEQPLKLVLTKCVPKGLAKVFEVVQKAKQSLCLRIRSQNSDFARTGRSLNTTGRLKKGSHIPPHWGESRSGSGEGLVPEMEMYSTFWIWEYVQN